LLAVMLLGISGIELLRRIRSVNQEVKQNAESYIGVRFRHSRKRAESIGSY
jgi:hypothetical protein